MGWVVQALAVARQVEAVQRKLQQHQAITDDDKKLDFDAVRKSLAAAYGVSESNLDTALVGKPFIYDGRSPTFRG